jgi:hypothetical protein
MPIFGNRHHQKACLLTNARIIVPSGALTAVVRQLLPVKQGLKETRRVLLLNVRIIFPSSALTATVSQAEIVLQQRQSTGRENNSHI